MEKITRLPISQIPSLKKLEDNWVKWGNELLEFKESEGKIGQGFSWRESCDKELRPLLYELTNGHCSFCDGFPIGETSLESIEHYHPKSDFPLLAYQWENLFYCCDKCNSEANKTTFKYTLKPDDKHYNFSSYLYFDASSGQLLVLEYLETTNPDMFVNATNFLQRYGINSPKRNMARIHLMNDIKNFIKSKESNDRRTRDSFKYRYIYDYIARLIG